MKNKFNRLSVQIAIVFLIAIVSSFVPELARGFFGDHLCEGQWQVEGALSFTTAGCQYGDWGKHDPVWHWGWRHWLWALMGFTLFVVQCVRIGFSFNE